MKGKSYLAENEPIFASHIRQRGLTYAKQGRVHILSYTEQGCEAMVEGTDDYHVHLAFQGSRMVKSRSTCDCLYGGYCKHMYAVLTVLDSMDGPDFKETTEDTVKRNAHNLNYVNALLSSDHEDEKDFFTHAVLLWPSKLPEKDADLLWLWEDTLAILKLRFVDSRFEDNVTAYERFLLAVPFPEEVSLRLLSLFLTEIKDESERLNFLMTLWENDYNLMKPILETVRKFPDSWLRTNVFLRNLAALEKSDLSLLAKSKIPNDANHQNAYLNVIKNRFRGQELSDIITEFLKSNRNNINADALEAFLSAIPPISKDDPNFVTIYKTLLQAKKPSLVFLASYLTSLKDEPDFKALARKSIREYVKNFNIKPPHRRGYFLTGEEHTAYVLLTLSEPETYPAYFIYWNCMDFAHFGFLFTKELFPLVKSRLKEILAHPDVDGDEGYLAYFQVIRLFSSQFDPKTYLEAAALKKAMRYSEARGAYLMLLSDLGLLSEVYPEMQVYGGKDHVA